MILAILGYTIITLLGVIGKLYRLCLQWHFFIKSSFFQAKRVKSAAKIKLGNVVGFAKDFRHNSLVRTSLPQPSALIPFPFARCRALRFAFFFPFFF
ncbi:hypothetical protein [Mucilaginibacter antarcticus]|uniref:Uncharacterized protein n=1 Tax=Mucilaginibacter antarcticus TaxID=1855725 RepID=A0ABW5XRS6_9SPHI